MRKNNYRYDQEPKKVYRKARPNDLEKYEEAKAKEHATMIRARQIAASLGLDMKIGDVEYQGDGNKAIFYYIADERVDFRQLIKVLAEAFRVRIEMKQIGARQEAGRIGGIGPCGRELCCSSWMTSFVSVATSAARYQDVSMNPQKLAGQCAKLKCCINYEIDAYVEASKKLPSREVPLETKDRTYFHFKTDILSGMITYSTDKQMPINAVTIPARRVFEIINMNKRGEKPDSLEQNVLPRDKAANAKDVAAQENVSRFDGKGKRRRKKGNQQAQAQQGQQPQGDKPKQQQGDKPKQAQGDKPKQAQGDKPKQQQGDKPKQQQGDKPKQLQENKPKQQQPKPQGEPQADKSQQPQSNRQRPNRSRQRPRGKQANDKEAKPDA